MEGSGKIVQGKAPVNGISVVAKDRAAEVIEHRADLMGVASERFDLDEAISQGTHLRPRGHAVSIWHDINGSPPRCFHQVNPHLYPTTNATSATSITNTTITRHPRVIDLAHPPVLEQLLVHTPGRSAPRAEENSAG